MSAPAESQEVERPMGVGSEFAVFAGYYGEFLVHPGVIGGVEVTLFESEGGGYRLATGGAFGIYGHPRNHVGLFIRPELVNRFTAGFGLIGDVTVGFGYLHTWLEGEVYERASDGGVETVLDPGSPHMMVSASLGFGWDLARNDVAPLSILIRVEGFGRYPYVGIMLPQLALQVGVVYRL